MLLWELGSALRARRFPTVGSNDLIQYLSAADRDNWRVASRFDCVAAGLFAAPCGPSPSRRAVWHARHPVRRDGRLLDAIALAAIGYRPSMSPALIGPGDKAALLGRPAREVSGIPCSR